MKTKIHILVKLFFVSLVCSSAVAQEVVKVDERAVSNPGVEWLNYGRDYQEQRFSPLKQINQSNISQLDLAWSFDFSAARGMEATPLVIMASYILVLVGVMFMQLMLELDDSDGILTPR